MKRNGGRVYRGVFAHSMCEWGYLFAASNECLQLSLNDMLEAV